MCGSILLHRNLLPVYCWFIDSSISPSLAWLVKRYMKLLLKNQKIRELLAFLPKLWFVLDHIWNPKLCT